MTNTADTPDPSTTTPATLRAAVDAALPTDARAWLADALTEAAKGAPGPSPSIPAWEAHFAAARRRAGGEQAMAVRILLLQAARADTDAATRIYERGDTAERIAILTALPHLEPSDDALPLVHDALRTNDTRLVAAALGPYGAEHLPAHDWRQAVLKCLFTGVPVTDIHDLADRARDDAELARMLRDYAAEREAAGRDVPQDLHRVLSLTAVTDGAADPGSATAPGASAPAVNEEG